MKRMDDDTTQQGDAIDAGQRAGRSIARPPVEFPRLVLPPAPTFGRPAPATPTVAEPAAPTTTPAPTSPATDLDDRPVGGRDEPPVTWQSPFPEPAAASAYTYRVVPPPMAPEAAQMPPSMVAAAAAAPVAAPAPIKASVPAPARTPVPAVAAPVIDDQPSEVATRPSTVALGLMAVTAALLMWASQMAFSSALLAFSGLLVAELALALSLARARGANRPLSSTLLAVVALLVGLLAAKGAIAQFGDMAMVAGLFVLISVVPSLLLLGAAALVLRRRGDRRTLADEAIRSGTLVRFGALAAILAAGYQAHKTFTAVPDAIVALVIVALVALNAVHVLRGSGRAAAR
jgi:hypothetical protein